MQRNANKLAPCKDGAPESIESVAGEWFATCSPDWAPSHATRIIRCPERDVFPWLGTTHAVQVTPAMVLAALRSVSGCSASKTRIQSAAGPPDNSF